MKSFTLSLLGGVCLSVSLLSWAAPEPTTQSKQPENAITQNNDSSQNPNKPIQQAPSNDSDTIGGWTSKELIPTHDQNLNTKFPTIVPPAPDIDAKGYVLMDAKSGIILAQKNMNKRLPPASLTKLMTMFVTSQAIRNGQIHLNDSVRISEKAWKTEGSRMFLKVGSRVSVQKLLEGIIVASGNDACVALAQYIAGSEKSFAQLMNQTALSLGMKNSHYMDSNGLPSPQHYTTPYDLALLTRAIINDFPEDYKWYQQKWIRFNGIKQPNRNRLLWRDPTVDGLKTGHTQAAGYCLVGSAKRDSMRLISVVMGAPTDSARMNDTQALLNWGFRFFESHELFKAKQPVITPRIWFGKNKTTELGVSRPVYITIPAGQYKKLKANMALPKHLKAPIVKGKVYGRVTISLHGKTIAQAPLIALQNDPEGGLSSRLMDRVILLFK